MRYTRPIRTRYPEHLAAKEHIGGTETERAALDGDPETFWSAPIRSYHAMLEVSLAKPVTFGHALLMEWLNEGAARGTFSRRGMERQGVDADGGRPGDRSQTDRSFCDSDGFVRSLKHPRVVGRGAHP